MFWQRILCDWTPTRLIDSCSFDEECHNGGYCDDLHVYDAHCICPRSYTGPYCTEYVSDGNDGSIDGFDANDAVVSNNNFYQKESKGRRLSAGALVGISTLGATLLLLGFLGGMMWAKRRVPRDKRTVASLEKPADGIFQEKDSNAEEGMQSDETSDATELGVRVV
jgi:hypothetical protein